MFGTIRKHQTWLWAVIITVIIVSFVVFFSPYSKFNSGRSGPVNLGSLSGQPVSEEEYSQTSREIYLRYFFMNGNWPDASVKNSGFDPQRDTYYRLLLIRKQNEMAIHISPDVVAQVAKDMVRPFEKMNITTPTMFVQQVLQPKGFQVDDFERFVRHELGLQELISTVGLAGKLVTPKEATGLYVREHEDLATEAAFFSATNYLAAITPTPEAISQFYSNRVANYRIPERMQVSYVKFDLTNFIAEADQELAKTTNLDQRIDAVYQKRGTNYYKDVKSPEEAKEKIREEMRKELSLFAARKKASAFATDVLNKEPWLPENLAAFAKEQGLTAQTTAPFDQEEGPKDLNVGTIFAKTAFGLSTNEPFAGPIIGDDAVYEIALGPRIPSEIPSLDSIRDRVTADFKFTQAVMLARAAGMEFFQTASNGFAQGKNFSAICDEAKIKPVEIPPFSLSTRGLPEVEDRIRLDSFKQIAFSTPPGKVSNSQPTVDGAVVLYVKSKLPPDEAKMKTDLPGFINYVRQTRQNEAFNEWFRKEAKRSGLDALLARPEPAIGAAAKKT